MQHPSRPLETLSGRTKEKPKWLFSFSHQSQQDASQPWETLEGPTRSLIPSSSKIVLQGSPGPMNFLLAQPSKYRSFSRFLIIYSEFLRKTNHWKCFCPDNRTIIFFSFIFLSSLSILLSKTHLGRGNPSFAQQSSFATSPWILHHFHFLFSLNFTCFCFSISFLLNSDLPQW